MPEFSVILRVHCQFGVEGSNDKSNVLLAGQFAAFAGLAGLAGIAGKVASECRILGRRIQFD